MRITDNMEEITMAKTAESRMTRALDVVLSLSLAVLIGLGYLIGHAFGAW